MATNLESIGTLIGILGAIGSAGFFLRNQHLLLQETMLARYDVISESYVEFQKLCLEYPEARASWYDYVDAVPNEYQGPSETSNIKRKLLFDIATSMFERAFVTYRNAPGRIKNSQWPGWNAFIENYCGRDDYRGWWKEHVIDFDSQKWTDGLSQYDREFEQFMRRKLTSKATKNRA